MTQEPVTKKPLGEAIEALILGKHIIDFSDWGVETNAEGTEKASLILAQIMITLYQVCDNKWGVIAQTALTELEEENKSFNDWKAMDLLIKILKEYHFIGPRQTRPIPTTIVKNLLERKHDEIFCQNIEEGGRWAAVVAASILVEFYHIPEDELTKATIAEAAARRIAEDALHYGIDIDVEGSCANIIIQTKQEDIIDWMKYAIKSEQAVGQNKAKMLEAMQKLQKRITELKRIKANIGEEAAV
ncbi:hypothetical protein KKA15_01640 [Patescibacteria group bacterium]|nr:hypothetical protein [Patescibacteria group bacterium]